MNGVASFKMFVMMFFCITIPVEQNCDVKNYFVCDFNWFMHQLTVSHSVTTFNVIP